MCRKCERENEKYRQIEKDGDESRACAHVYVKKRNKMKGNNAWIERDAWEKMSGEEQKWRKEGYYLSSPGDFHRMDSGMEWNFEWMIHDIWWMKYIKCVKMWQNFRLHEYMHMHMKEQKAWDIVPGSQVLSEKWKWGECKMWGEWNGMKWNEWSTNWMI